jgi:single-strand DNA-binding protein
MASYNKIMIMGNVGKNPEMRFTPNGLAVTTFTVAVNKTITGKSGQPEKLTDWFNVKAWKGLAETCNQYLSKGKRVFVEGQLHFNNYEKDGQKRQFVEINADRVIFLSPMEGGDAILPDGAQANPTVAPTGDIDPSELAFD